MTSLINTIDQTINFNDQTIRIVGTYDSPMFVASDICKILGLTNVTETLRSLPDKWKKICDLSLSEVTSTARKQQEMNCISEAGLYKIIMRSNKPIAQKFQEVVCEEILPSIRKTGEFKLQKMLDEEKMIRKNMKAKYECYLERRIDIDNKYQKGAVVYIIGYEEIPFDYKLGCTFNLKRRLSDYHSVCPYEPILYYKKYLKFDNSTSIDEKFQLLVEQMLHHIIRKFRTKHSKEWFQTKDLNIFVKELDDLALYLQKKDESFRDVVPVKESVKDILKKIKNDSTQAIENVIKDETTDGENENNDEDELEKEVFDVEVESEEVNEEENHSDEESKFDLEDTEEKPTIVLNDDTKKCAKCKLYLSKDSFAKSSKKDGLDSRCKECKKKQYRDSKKKAKLLLDEKNVQNVTC